MADILNGDYFLEVLDVVRVFLALVARLVGAAAFTVGADGVSSTGAGAGALEITVSASSCAATTSCSIVSTFCAIALILSLFEVVVDGVVVVTPPDAGWLAYLVPNFLPLAMILLFFPMGDYCVVK